jgi:hypothetical protein
MSRVYWQAEDGVAELHGSERAWLRQLVAGWATIAWGLRDPYDDLARADAILALIPVDERGYLQEYRDRVSADPDNPQQVQTFVRALDTALKVGGLRLDVNGERLHVDDVAANTALATRSAPIQLATKIHGWCEVHCWTEGPDRQWMASVIEEGLDERLYRWGMFYHSHPLGKKKWAEQGWKEVLELLRAGDRGPVVLSYSVTDSFPNREIAAWSPPATSAVWRPDYYSEAEWTALSVRERQDHLAEHLDELFGELPAAQRWEYAVDGLRQKRPWARLGPDTLGSTHFGAPVTIDDLFASDRDERVARALTVPMAT